MHLFSQVTGLETATLLGKGETRALLLIVSLYFFKATLLRCIQFRSRVTLPTKKRKEIDLLL